MIVSDFSDMWKLGWYQLTEPRLFAISDLIALLTLRIRPIMD